MTFKRSTLFYYGLTDLPVSMSLFPVLVFIPKFYTSEMGVPLAVAAKRHPRGAHLRSIE